MKRTLSIASAFAAAIALAGQPLSFRGFVDEVMVGNDEMYITDWVRVEKVMSQDLAERPGCAVRLNLTNDELNQLGWCSGSGKFRNLFGLRCNDEDPDVRRAADRSYDNLRIAHVKRWAVRVVIDPATYMRRHDGEKICMVRRVWLDHRA